MKLLLPSQQFLGPDEHNFGNYNAAKFAILQAPLEQTVSYGHGTAEGPAGILAASSQIEFWDAELKSYPFTEGVPTFEPFVFGADPRENMNQIADGFLQVLRDKKIPVLLGGEHSVTLGGIKGVVAYREEQGKSHDPFTILQFDAHGDLRFEYEGTIYSHACVMRQCLEHFSTVNLVQVGIRAICEEEEQFIVANKESGRVATFFAHERKNWNAEKILAAIQTEDVYITFDVDGLDPSLLPATGTPVPNGLFWQETMEILKLVGAQKNVMAMDIAELAPRAGFEYCDFAAALLTAKMIAYAKKT